MEDGGSSLPVQPKETKMTQTPRFLVAAGLALLAAVPCFAQDKAPITDLRLDRFEVVPVKDGAAVTVNASVGVALCGAAQSYKTSLRLVTGGKVLAEAPIEVSTDIGGDCANTKNGSCSGVKCPDAIINGKVKKGTCQNGTMGGLCVCDYGTVSASFEAVEVRNGEALQLQLDGDQSVQEISEGNNYGAVTVAADAKTGNAVYQLDDPTTVASLQKSRLIPAASGDGVAFTDSAIEQTGKTKTVVLRGIDEKGNCRTWGAQLTDLGLVSSTKHTCTGSPCSSCAFTYDPSGSTINGCICASATGTCNHTISTGNSVQ